MTKEPLKILVVGTGSAGTRHLENLLSSGAEVSAFSYRPDRRDFLSGRYGIRVFSSLEQALDSPQDAVVISNSTDRHVETALAAARRGLHMFIEKPLSNRIDGVGELAGLVAAQSLAVEMGCTMRFHPNLARIRELLAEGAIGRVYSARACVGQYLPDWRPGQDYRLSYSARAELGGGVLFDLVHELDFLHWWFGPIKEVSAFLERLSDLEIDVEDLAQILLRFQSGVLAQVHMDYVRPFYRRTCEIVGEDGVIDWDYVSGTVRIDRKGARGPDTLTVPEGFGRNDMFLDHIRFFLNRIRRGGEAAVGIEDGIHILKAALAAHESSRERKTVSV